MRRLIVCCDGTWNTPDQEQDGIPSPTNVVRLYNAVADEDAAGAKQLKYYHPGVGTEGNWWQKLAGGTVGAGLSRNVMSAYKWLGVEYERGDRIYLFGFSRGAYTVRSLAGMIAACGLLDLSAVPDDEVWTRVETAFDKGYHPKKNKRKPRSEWGDDWAFHSDGTPGGGIRIFFLGVWDTVGALGIPDDLAILNVFDDREKYAFHDTKLSKMVLHARHAVGIDEMRVSFTPTLWTGVADREGVKQLWFPGVHSDVGGGYLEKGLSDGALRWMMDEAKAAGEPDDPGLEFHSGMYNQVAPNPRDVLHDSRKGLFKHLRTQPRSVPLLTDGQETVHTSTRDRASNPPIEQAPYRHTQTLSPGSQTEPLAIYAARSWNETGLYLEAGVTYAFSAKGEWLDRTITCGPGGTNDGDFQAGEVVHLAGTLWGKLEGLFKKVTGNEQADFKGSKRVEAMPWFSLVGAIANGGNPAADGTPAPHELIHIGDGCTHKPSKSGYLYCFANDAWHFYGNNHGSVMLTVARE